MSERGETNDSDDDVGRRPFDESCDLLTAEVAGGLQVPSKACTIRAIRKNEKLLQVVGEISLGLVTLLT